MRQLILIAAMAITFGTAFAAQPEVTRHISREAAIKVLRDPLSGAAILESG